MTIETPGDRPVVTTISGTDKIRVNVGGVFKEITADDLATALGVITGSGVWGGITGTLSDQTDLASALSAKALASRTVNGHALTADVTVSAADVGLGGGNDVGFNSVSIFGAKIRSGAGSPESTLIGNPGDIYLNVSGGAGTTLYVKESGTGNTGWIGK